MDACADEYFTISVVHPDSEYMISENVTTPNGYEIMESANNNLRRYIILKSNQLDADMAITIDHINIQQVHVGRSKNSTAFYITFNEEGYQRLNKISQLCKRNYPRYPRIAIIVNGEIVAAPRIYILTPNIRIETTDEGIKKYLNKSYRRVDKLTIVSGASQWRLSEVPVSALVGDAIVSDAILGDAIVNFAINGVVSPGQSSVPVGMIP